MNKYLKSILKCTTLFFTITFFSFLVISACSDEPTQPEPDTDGDGVEDKIDNCIDEYNSDQKDTDGDGIGDVCDPDNYDGPLGDPDEDGIPNKDDSCPNDYNEGTDYDNDGIDDACDPPPVYASVFGLYDDFDGNGAMQTYSGLPLAVAGEFSEKLWSNASNSEVIHLDDIVDYEVSSGANPGGYIAKTNGGRLAPSNTWFFLTKIEDYKSWSADVLLMNTGEGVSVVVMDYHTYIPEQGGLSWYSQIGIKQNSDGDKYIFAQINNKNTEYQFWKTLDAELNTWYNLRMDFVKLNETELEVQFYVNGVLLASEIPPDGEILLDQDRMPIPGQFFDTNGTVLIDNVEAVFKDQIQ